MDNYLPVYNPKERIEVFWNEVCQLQSADGNYRYTLLPVAFKSALALGQTNAESESSLSVNARIVAQERGSLGEKTIVVIKDAVRFYDLVSNRVEMIPMTQDLKKSVSSAHLAYKANLEREKEEQKKRKMLGKRKKYLTGYKKREEKLIEKKESLAKKKRT